MSEHDDQKWFEEYLHGRSRLSQAYRALGRPEPSARVDRAIGEAARIPASAAARWLRWPVSLASAAVLVLSITVVAHLIGERSVLGPAAPRPDAAVPVDPPPAVLPGERTPPAGQANRPRASEHSGLQAPSWASTPDQPRDLTAGEAIQNENRNREAVDSFNRQIIDRAQRDAESLRHAPELPSPEEWLAEIRSLHETGQQHAAEQELERFLIAYPNYPRENLAEF